MRERKGWLGARRGAGGLLGEAATVGRRCTDVSTSCNGLLKNERGGPRALEMGTCPHEGLLGMSSVDPWADTLS